MPTASSTTVGRRIGLPKPCAGRTDGRGADLVLETGGAETFARSVSVAAMGGTVFVIGFLTGTQPTIDVVPVMEKEVRIQGNHTGPVAALRAACAAMAAHRLTPVVDRVFEMRDAAAAYAHLAKGGRHFGKIAIVLRAVRRGRVAAARDGARRPSRNEEHPPSRGGRGWARLPRE